MEFETKDWIIMLVPVVLEGIVIFIFQKLFNRSIDKKFAFKDNIIYSFFGQIKDIQTEYQYIFNSQKEVSNEDIQKFIDRINPTYLYFQKNLRDLKKFKNEYYNFYFSWIKLVEIWNIYVESEQNPESKLGKELTHQLEVCESATTTLVNKIRNKEF